MRKFRDGVADWDSREFSRRSGLACPPEEARTHQEFKEETDINTLLKRFKVTGQLPENVRRPTFGDFTGVDDFHSAANAIAKAHESFDQMPANVRKRFNHDPGAFVEFCSDEKNLDEMRRLGLAVPAKPKEDVTPLILSTSPSAAQPQEAPKAPSTPAPSAGGSGSTVST